MNKSLIKLFFLLLPIFLNALGFKVANYNVENLFDMYYSTNEYDEYIPNGRYGWSESLYRKKLSNISKVIYDMSADIITLEEIESKEALLALRERIKKRGLFYRYYAIADKKNSVVKVALLSRYKITKIKDIKVSYQKNYRDILEVHVDIKGYPLVLFVNHWKSKSAPESERLKYAKALEKRLSSLPKSTEYIVLGDFNSNYNEYITFLHDRNFNNTGGKTGINNILKTVYNGKMVTLDQARHNCSLLYNLWLELPLPERYSYIYHGEKDTIDNILLPCSMFDGKGIDYIKNSYNVFKPDYLFKNGLIYRWQKVNGYGKFSGKGYSDHLPVYAYFSTDKHHKKYNKQKQKHYREVTIDDLYRPFFKNLPVMIKNAAVIYRDKSGVIVKKLHQRAIYLYKHNSIFKKGYMYDIVVDAIEKYKGNLEINSIKNATRQAKIENIKKYFLHYKRGMDLSSKRYTNEVLYKISGIYNRGYLYYGKRKKIRLFSKIKNFELQNNSHIVLFGTRIAIYGSKPEIIVYYKYQIKGER